MSSRSSTSKRRTGISKEGKADMALAAGDDTNRTVGGALANSPAPPKKLKIFHYFGGKGEGACVRPLELRRGAPLAREASRADEATVKNGTGHVHVDSGRALGIGMTGQERREAEAGDAPAEVSTTVSTVPSPAPTPSWGKMVDPRKKQRWDLLRRLREGQPMSDGGGGAGDRTVWWRRSYSLAYASIFQDERTPGMGSTSVTWGWASQSHVFGGARACVRQQTISDATVKLSPPRKSSYGDSKRHSDDPAVDSECGKGGGRREGNSRTSNGSDPAGQRTPAHGSIPRKHDRSVQARNFRLMHSWLSSSPLSRLVSDADTETAPSPVVSPSPHSSSETATRSTCPQTLLDVILEREDGGLRAAFMALVSLDKQVASGSGMDHGDMRHTPLSLALRLYHGASTWRRYCRRPPSRRPGPSRGSRLHPDDPSLAAAIDDADARGRARIVEAEFESALCLIDAGLAVSLDDVTGSDVGEGSRHSGACGSVDKTDVLAALMPSEVLTAAETRALAKGLGVAVSVPLAVPARDRDRGVLGVTAGSVNRYGRREERRVESKDEVCSAIEQWFSRPPDAAKRRARVTRAARLAAGLMGAGSGTSSSSGGHCDGRDIIVLRLADNAQEVIHRVHVAFFASSRHGPCDASAVLQEDLSLVSFGGDVFNDCSGLFSETGGNGGSAKRDTSCIGIEVASVEGQLQRCVGLGSSNSSRNLRPPPDILSSVEAFAEFYRLVNLADAMDLAAGAGDSGLAYGSLHEASTALLPSGCPLCRLRGRRLRKIKTEMGERGEEVDLVLGHCNICELSARVVMRGVSLMERDRDYDNAFHYLKILLQAPSQRLSVYRPRYWLRLVTDLGHKKRAMESLRSCEKALLEACSPRDDPVAVPVETMASAARRAQSGAGGVVEVVTPAEAAAVLPLGEALPLLRRAVKLAVPPLRWRKRAPPDVKQARLKVLRMDLSWRRRTDQGSPSSGSPRIGLVQPGKESMGTSDAERMEGEEAMAAGGGGGGGGGGCTEGGSEEVGRPTVAQGMSLEQAVLDSMLEDLGAEWTGLHAENSICLGLFALLCWDAFFAAEVPASAALGSADLDVQPDLAIVSGNQIPRALTPTSRTEQSDIIECDGNDDKSKVSSECKAGERAATEGPLRESYFLFSSPFQSEPDDLMTTSFAGRRQHILEHLYACVERGEAAAVLRRNWDRHYGKACTGLQWNLFPDGVEGWVTVACAIGPLPLSRVCRNLASNYWAWRHGLPDLFLWRKNATTTAAPGTVAHPPRVEQPRESGADAGEIAGGKSSRADAEVAACTASSGLAEPSRQSSPGNDEDAEGSRVADSVITTRREACCKWVEVKGPGDSLSCAQEAWIDTLVGAGAEAILLRVEDTAASR